MPLVNPNPADLPEKILSERINEWVFNNLKTTGYLVGGYLRDALLCRNSMDIDYVIDGDPLEIAKQTARKFNGTLIIFKNTVFRIVLRNGKVIDFTPLRGSIHDDLMLRDFTINAMAWSPKSGFIDPLGGLKDLEKGVIRVFSSRSLKDDPLRVLRAYRHAVELCFTIDEETSALLRLHAPELKSIAPERITGEFFRILNQKNCCYHLKKSFIDGILQEVTKLDKETLTRNLRLLKRYEAFIERNGKRINSFFRKRENDDFLGEEINQGLKRDGLIKLFLILKNHKIIKREISLRPSKSIRKIISSISKGLDNVRGKITDERLYHIFSASGEYIYETAIVLSLIHEKRLKEFLRRAEDFIKFRKRPLLNGEEIQDLLKCGSGIIVGKSIALLHKAQFLGQISTKPQAKRLILSNLT